MKSHLAIAMFCAVVPIARGQVTLAPQSTPSSSIPSITTSSSLVLVPSLVRSRSGELVYSLTAGDFLLTDDGTSQKLMLEEDTGGEPLALVVAIEIGGAGARQLDKLGAVASMLDSVVGNVPHSISVVAFDSQPSLVQDFTVDTDQAANAISTLIAGCTKDSASSPSCQTGDNGAAILDALGLSVDLLRKQPSSYRRAILLISESNDRGSRLTLEGAVRSISDTNTAIYSIGFSSAKSETAHYAHRELPTQPSVPHGSWLSLENHEPNPPGGCMSKDVNADPDATRNKAVKGYDCLTQLAPPLALAKMAVIAATTGLRRNTPETVSQLTGGDYFKLSNAKSLEQDLSTISNHLANRYVLSFQPTSPHPGLHTISLQLPGHPNLNVTARKSYWAGSTPIPVPEKTGHK